jgi:hypothetical protein
MPKISQLSSYTNPQDSDVQPIVDTANATTKKITWSSIKSALKNYFDTLYSSIYPRQSTQTSPTSITPDKSQFDEYYVTALANAITINNASSPSVGDIFVIYLTDDGTARSISWGSHYVGLGLSLPTSTTANKTMEIIIKYIGSAKALVSYANQV